MNTDNMSVLGLTIDYGPYGWLENYDPNWTPNTTDAGSRRYSFGNQPKIAYWNLVQLANAVYPLIGKIEPLQQALSVYSKQFQEGWQAMMAKKLGLKTFKSATDDSLVTELLAILPLAETDMTIFFRRLAMIDVDVKSLRNTSDETLMAPVMPAYYLPEQLTHEYRTRMGSWLRDYLIRLAKDNTSHETRRRRMNAVNPKYVLRNYLAQLAIEKAEQGDFSLVNELLEVMRYPYDEQSGKEEFAKKRPEWARHRPGCSMLSCSS
jgi:uncharacterized protein YdiU (UPF0061 family)